MRVLIYSETAEAKLKLDRLRSEGHHASLRNPQFFNSAQIEKCDLAIADNDVIINAYRDAGFETERLTASAQIPTPVIVEEVKPELAEAVTTQPYMRRGRR